MWLASFVDLPRWDPEASRVPARGRLDITSAPLRNCPRSGLIFTRTQFRHRTYRDGSCVCRNEFRSRHYECAGRSRLRGPVGRGEHFGDEGRIVRGVLREEDGRLSVFVDLLHKMLVEAIELERRAARYLGAIGAHGFQIGVGKNAQRKLGGRPGLGKRRVWSPAWLPRAL